MVHRAHEGDQLFVDDADDLLAGIKRAENLLADGLFGHARDKFVGDRIVDVGVEKGAADFLETVANIALGQATAAAQLLESLAQTSLNALEHVTDNPLPAKTPAQSAPNGKPKIIRKKAAFCNVTLLRVVVQFDNGQVR